MGGARDMGNITPATEFNFCVDPHAAHIVFESGAKITMLGLDVTHQALATPAWIEKMKQKGGLINEVVGSVLDIHVRYDIDRYKSSGGPIHDPCVIAYLLQPDLFTGRDVHVKIETASEDNMGRSIVDWGGRWDLKPNAHVVGSIDSQTFFNLVEDVLDLYTEKAPALS